MTTMNTLIPLLVVSIFISSCHEYHISLENKKAFKQRKNEPSYTIIVEHHECTECLDAIMMDGKVGVPDDLKSILGDTLGGSDILLVGNFPHDLINNTTLFYEHHSFKIRGKIIGMGNAFVFPTGKAPQFYVEKWEIAK